MIKLTLTPFDVSTVVNALGTQSDMARMLREAIMNEANRQMAEQQAAQQAAAQQEPQPADVQPVEAANG